MFCTFSHIFILNPNKNLQILNHFNSQLLDCCLKKSEQVLVFYVGGFQKDIFEGFHETKSNEIIKIYFANNLQVVKRKKRVKLPNIDCKAVKSGSSPHARTNSSSFCAVFLGFYRRHKFMIYWRRKICVRVFDEIICRN